MATNRFWGNVPKLSPKATQWKPGEARSYIPVLSFARPETVTPGGQVGKTAFMDGSSRVSFVVHGTKHGKTK